MGMEGVYLVGHTTSSDGIATDTLCHQADAGDWSTPATLRDARTADSNSEPTDVQVRYRVVVE